MKTSWLLWAGLVSALLSALGGFALWVREPWNPTNPWNCRRIVPGMSRAQVLDILGSPTETEVQSEPMGFTRIVEVLQWYGDNNWMLVAINEEGRVAEKSFSTGVDPFTFRQRIQMWFGVIPDE